MIYEGIIGYDYNNIVSEVNCYVDNARKVITINSEEAGGACDGDNVIVFYDVADLMPMVITERIDKDKIDIDKLNKRIYIFNKKQNNFVAVIEDHDPYYDVTVTRSKIYKVVQEM